MLKKFMLGGADFKYNNSFSKLRPKNIYTKHFWSQILRIFVVTQNFYLDKFAGADFKQQFFKFQL